MAEEEILLVFGKISAQHKVRQNTRQEIGNRRRKKHAVKPKEHGQNKHQRNNQQHLARQAERGRPKRFVDGLEEAAAQNLQGVKGGKNV